MVSIIIIYLFLIVILSIFIFVGVDIGVNIGLVDVMELVRLVVIWVNSSIVFISEDSFYIFGWYVLVLDIVYCLLKYDW